MTVRKQVEDSFSTGKQLIIEESDSGWVTFRIVGDAMETLGMVSVNRADAAELGYALVRLWETS